MNIDQMRYFLEVARCASLAEAARHLHITQPTLSRQLSNMEGELNIQLFVRTNHGMRLTTAGEVLFKEWTKTIESYETSVEKATYAFKAIRGSLSIGVLDGLKTDSFLPSMIEFIQTNYPNIQIKLKRQSFIEITSQINHGEIDLAISLDVNFFGQESLKTRNIRPYLPAIAVPRRKALAQKEDITLADFKDEEFVTVNRSECEYGIVRLIEAYKTFAGFYPEFYYVDSMADANLWVEAGLKCALLNMEMSLADSPEVRMIPMSDDNEGHFVQMAYNKSNNNAVWDLIKDYFQ